MRYPPAETAEKHVRILDAAARLFRERGFADVSVSEIMKATGLTHGPFYNHFASKDALMAEAVGHASRQALEMLDTLSFDADGRAAFLDDYLATHHRDAPGEGCLMAALATEIGREPTVKAGLTAHVRAVAGRLAGFFPGSSKRRARSQSLRMLSTIVGAVILARGVDDEALSREILDEAAASLR